MRSLKIHFTTFTSSIDEATELNYLYLPSNVLDMAHCPLPWQQFTWYIAVAHVNRLCMYSLP